MTVVRHDPHDVIADCDANLAIITRCELAMKGPSPGASDAIKAAHIVLWRLADPVLKDLAHGYRHRPGWKETWTA